MEVISLPASSRVQTGNNVSMGSTSTESSYREHADKTCNSLMLVWILLDACWTQMHSTSQIYTIDASLSQEILISHLKRCCMSCATPNHKGIMETCPYHWSATTQGYNLEPSGLWKIRFPRLTLGTDIREMDEVYQVCLCPAQYLHPRDEPDLEDQAALPGENDSCAEIMDFIGLQGHGLSSISVIVSSPSFP